MKVAPIAPFEFLKHLDGLNVSIHMALAQKVFTDTYYWSFYRVHGQMGGAHVIMDNGAAEDERLSLERLMVAANRIMPDEIVLPDVLKDSDRTIAASTHKDVLRQIPPRHRMIVPQGVEPEEWMSCLQTLHSLLDGLYVSIGVPKHFNEVSPHARTRFVQQIRADPTYDFAHIHLLGMHMTPAKELHYLKPVLQGRMVRSIDTAAPLAYAQAGVKVLEADQKYSIDWEAHAEVQLFIDNMHDLMEAFYVAEFAD